MTTMRVESGNLTDMLLGLGHADPQLSADGPVKGEEQAFSTVIAQAVDEVPAVPTPVLEAPKATGAPPFVPLIAGGRNAAGSPNEPDRIPEPGNEPRASKETPQPQEAARAWAHFPRPVKGSAFEAGPRIPEGAINLRATEILSSDGEMGPSPTMEEAFRAPLPPEIAHGAEACCLPAQAGEQWSASALAGPDTAPWWRPEETALSQAGPKLQPNPWVVFQRSTPPDSREEGAELPGTEEAIAGFPRAADEGAADEGATDTGHSIVPAVTTPNWRGAATESHLEGDDVNVEMAIDTIQAQPRSPSPTKAIVGKGTREVVGSPLQSRNDGAPAPRPEPSSEDGMLHVPRLPPPMPARGQAATPTQPAPVPERGGGEAVTPHLP
ncbi:MAG: hypothetical protein HY698_19235, partial [Deltaproteobacteria bacterium]|nr:hypothetical protein [Deltaproteobacteria bacterium]